MPDGLPHAYPIIGVGPCKHDRPVQTCLRLYVSTPLCTDNIPSASGLFTEQLDHNECLLLVGLERYSDYVGYASTFSFRQDHRDSLPRYLLFYSALTADTATAYVLAHCSIAKDNRSYQYWLRFRSTWSLVCVDG